MNNNFEEVIEKYRRRIHTDESIERVIAGLHSDGLTITDSLKAVRILYSVDLGEAKKLVTAHPVWSSVVRANEPLHDALEKSVAAWSNDNANVTDMADTENNA